MGRVVFDGILYFFSSLQYPLTCILFIKNQRFFTQEPALIFREYAANVSGYL